MKSQQTVRLFDSNSTSSCWPKQGLQECISSLNALPDRAEMTEHSNRGLPGLSNITEVIISMVKGANVPVIFCWSS